MPKCLACHSPNLSPWTQAEDVEYFSVPDRFSYYHCADCDSLSIDPVPRNLLSKIYPSNYYSFSKQKESFLLKVKVFLDGLLFRKILKTISKPKINALDVGGGEGWMLSVLAGLDARVQHRQIVDIDQRAKVLAEEKGHEYFCGRFEDFKTETNFDLILMLNLIEHVENPREILEKAFQCLDQNGSVLIKTPNYQSWDARIFRHRSWAGYHCPRHWVLFSMESFENLARQVGFQIEMKKFTQGSPFWSLSILHEIHRRGWIQLSSSRPAHTHPLLPFLSLIFAGLDFLRLPFFRTSQMFFILKKR